MSTTAEFGHQKTTDPIVRRSELASELGVSETTLWRWAKTDFLPAPLQLRGRTGWPRSVVDQWKIERGWPETGPTHLQQQAHDRG